MCFCDKPFWESTSSNIFVTSDNSRQSVFFDQNLILNFFTCGSDDFERFLVFQGFAEADLVFGVNTNEVVVSFLKSNQLLLYR